MSYCTNRSRVADNSPVRRELEISRGKADAQAVRANASLLLMLAGHSPDLCR